MRVSLEQRKGILRHVSKTRETHEAELALATKDLADKEASREIIKIVGRDTLAQLQSHISDVTSVAMDSVFPDAYKLQVDFIERHNKTECDLYFTRGDYRISPLEASGGGAVDVASFALRIASWCLRTPRARRVLILDEPMRFVSEEYKETVSKMIKEVSSKLGIQFIIITHEPRLAAWADRTFEVSNKKGVSIINQK